MKTPKTLAALKTIASTPHIRAYLLASDPKALEQVEAAIASKERQLAKLQEIADQYAAALPAAFRLPEVSE